ncbi:hypothetical protein PsorP6_005905 [Peronosclerospora sorghi]|uniref:Uncharacterized protein n=1 Tax=Peronosclerospora sorghi TaxID=230839 RepID=A0ACC0W925_9STRA|nr:hypothetical protein PsorP6_005905 [Peronosclerospora sorghi]
MAETSSDHDLGAAATKKRKFLSAAWDHYDFVPYPVNKTCSSNDRRIFTMSTMPTERNQVRATQKWSWMTMNALPVHESRVTQKSEIEEYFNEPRVKLKPADEKNFRILDCWNAAQSEYPNLSRMARDILTIPVSSVASESVSTNWIFYYFGG